MRDGPPDDPGSYLPPEPPRDNSPDEVRRQTHEAERAEAYRNVTHPVKRAIVEAARATPRVRPSTFREMTFHAEEGRV